jgi:hypothetical protein
MHEFNVFNPSGYHSVLGVERRFLIQVNADDSATWPNHFGKQHTHVTCTGAEINDAHA